MEQPKMNRWLILIASTVINLCVGAIYAFSVFAGPLSAHHGWTIGQVMMAFAINSAISPIPMIVGGKILDKGGAKICVLVGGALFGLGLFLVGFATTPTMLYLTYGIVSGLGCGIAYSGTLGNTVKLFPDKRGLASGIVTAGYGGAAIIAAPIANYLIQNYGVLSAFKYIGIAYMIITVVAGLFVKAAPQGYKPKGWTPPVVSRPGGENVPWTKMIGTLRFYIIALMFTFAALSGMMVAAHASVIGQQMFGLTATIAALYVSVYALSNCLGRIIWGAVSDRIGRNNALLGIYLVIACMMFLLAISSSSMGFLISIVGIGICFGGTMGVFPGIVSENFGMKYYGVNYGITFIGFSAAAFFGPRIAAQVASANNGNFTNAFYIALSISLAGFILALLFKWVEKRDSKGKSTSLTKEIA